MEELKTQRTEDEIQTDIDSVKAQIKSANDQGITDVFIVPLHSQLVQLEEELRRMNNSWSPSNQISWQDRVEAEELRSNGIEPSDFDYMQTLIRENNS